MRNQVLSNHILSTAAPMGGLCLTAIALLHVTGHNQISFFDELLSVDMLIFILATFFSYASLRGGKVGRLEKIADLTFILGMFLLGLFSVLFVFYGI